MAANQQDQSNAMTTQGDLASQLANPLEAWFAEEKESESSSPNYNAHRRVSLNDRGADGTLVWTTPWLPKEEGVDFEEFPNCEQAVLTRIKGFVGFFIEAASGFGFDYNQDEKQYTCRTTKVVHRVGDEEYEDRSIYPLPFPVRTPNTSNGKPHEFNYKLDKMEKKTGSVLYGSRPQVGYEFAEGEEDDPARIPRRTCRECVEAGEHYKGELDENGRLSAENQGCSVKGTFKFCVFLVVREKDSGGVEYLKPEDLGIETLNGPFVVSFSSVGKIQLREVGKEKYHLNVITTGNKALVDSTYVSYGQYFNAISKDRNRFVLDNKMVYNHLTEIRMAKLSTKIPPNTGFAPLFKSIQTPAVKRDLLDSGVLAHQAKTYEAVEQAMANNEFTDITLPADNPVWDAMVEDGHIQDTGGNNGNGNGNGGDLPSPGDGPKPVQAEVETEDNGEDTSEEASGANIFGKDAFTSFS